MRKFHIAYLLVFAPVLMGADTDEFASTLNPLIANSLPICSDSQFLTYASGGLACREVVGAMLNVPDCNKTGQLLTYTKGSEIGVYTCVDKGTESLDAADITLINQTYTRLQNFKTTINNLMPGSKASVAKYCGQYTAATNQNGAITGNNGITGVAGAANLCSTVPACGTGARMCTVYDMYNSVAFGAVPATLGQSWVHMQSWSHNDATQVPTANGLADNCSGWTYPTGDKKWYGTTVEWKNAATGQKALHFASGPGVVACSARFPIACCK